MLRKRTQRTSRNKRSKQKQLRQCYTRKKERAKLPLKEKTSHDCWSSERNLRKSEKSPEINPRGEKTAGKIVTVVRKQRKGGANFTPREKRERTSLI